MNIDKTTQYDSNRQVRWEVQKLKLGRLLSAKSFLIVKLQRVLESMTAQGITTAGNLLYGLLCVRLLSIDGYAKFSVLFAFQGSLFILMDIGSTSALVSIIGERIEDLQLIADYVASLRQLAVRLFAILGPITVVIFPLIVKRQHWSAGSVAFLVSMLLVSAWFARVRSAYGAVLTLRRDRKQWYRAQLISSLGTLALLLAAWVTHLLNEYVAMVLNIVGMVYISIAYYLRSRQIIGLSGRPSRQRRQAILKLIMPCIPNLIFLALQGQISLMLITLFGRTSGVAAVGALSRLVQVFLIFNQVNPILLEPYFAKLPVSRLKINYLAVVVAAGSVGLSLVILARIWPGLFLWVLGEKYAHFNLEVVLVMVSGAISYVAGVLFCINTARRFVYWWANISIIVLTISVQALFMWKTDLGTVRSVLIFNIWSNLITLVITISCGVHGFLYGPRNVELA